MTDKMDRPEARYPDAASENSIWDSLNAVFDREGNRIAVEWNGRSVSYRDLESRSRAIAACLDSHRIVRGSVVAVSVERMDEFVAAVLGVLRAGCVFAPLDAELPKKRIDDMLGEIEPACIIFESATLKKLSEHAVLFPPMGLCLDEPAEVAVGLGRMVTVEGTGDKTNAGDFPFALEPDDMCYLYFTSGSTGGPKAVAGSAKGVDHYIRWETTAIGIGGECRCSQLTSQSFDAFLRDMFMPLRAGGTMCIPPAGDIVRNPAKLVRWIDDNRVTLVHCVPTVFRVIVNEEPAPSGFQNLRHVLIAGEHLYAADVKKWRDSYGDGVQLVNLYGSTETTMTKFCHFVSDADLERRIIPVGKPIDGATAIILDEELAVCPPGVVGEIYVRTPYATLGYFNRDDLTREVFIQNPFSGDSEDLIYRTGDFGRMRDDGVYEVLGRKDRQVKVQGVRIELDEVERAFYEIEEVSEAAVMEWKNPHDEVILCAYIVTKHEISDQQIRKALARLLPQSHIPPLLVRLDALPKGTTGKIERRSLPPLLGTGIEQSEHVPPRNDIERKLERIFREVLEAGARIGVDDNFFALGGNSLRATQVESRIAQVFGIQLPLRAVFEEPTIAGIGCRLVERKIEDLDRVETERLLSSVGSLSPEEVRARIKELRRSDD